VTTTQSDNFDHTPAADILISALRQEINRHIIGHQDLIEDLIAALLAGGHVLLEGVPGLGKTMLARVVAETISLDFSRIQCTPDLMPADIIGTRIVMQQEHGARQFEFQPGPLFTELLLADEVNRATPKTQSALLEAMEERQVTVGLEQHKLAETFTVFATQNPIEMEGTYPLPEAQLDRFMVKLTAQFPSAQALATIVDRETIGSKAKVETILQANMLSALRKQVRDIALAQHVRDYAVSIIVATHPSETNTVADISRYVRHGASPRGLLSVVLTAKARALMQGRANVSFDDIDAAVKPALRHRLIQNFEGEAQGLNTDDLLESVLHATARPSA
jgi:MoxR-like ATPase